MYSVTTINSTLTAPPQRVELSCGEGSFICLHLDFKSWLALYTQFFYKFLHFEFAPNIHFIIKMPRVKQSPRKNLRDIPNPTNWASILRNNHRKYFYLIFCGRMQSDGCIVRSDGYILWSDGIKLLILKTCTLLYIINLFNFVVRCGGTVTCCGRTVNSML